MQRKTRHAAPHVGVTRCVQTERRSEQGSSPRQRLQDRASEPPSRCPTTPGDDRRRRAQSQSDHSLSDRLPPPPSLRRSSPEGRREVFRYGRFDAELPAPRKELVDIEIVTPRDLGKCAFGYPRLGATRLAWAFVDKEHSDAIAVCYSALGFPTETQGSARPGIMWFSTRQRR